MAINFSEWFSSKPKSANVDTLDRLLACLLAEEQRASEKMADRDYWLDVGDLEMQAARDIRRYLGSIPLTLPDSSYTAHVVSALEELAQQWRCNSDDQDGYALATVHAVGKLLPGYGDRV